jgi:DNA-binding NtrC family response regulator
MESRAVQIDKIFKEKVVEWIPTREIKKILLIDRSKDGALSAALSQGGYHVVHCDSVQKAWSFIYPHPPHLIVVHLDDLNPASLADLQECWALAEGVPIMLATSAQVNQPLREAVQHRAAGILTLPAMLKNDRETLNESSAHSFSNFLGAKQCQTGKI